jgi:hypothetical protein
MARKPKNPFWVNWRKHPAREIILQDLNHGGWLYDELEEKGELDLAVAFALYNYMNPEVFNEIDFSQFEQRVTDYLEKNKERRDRSKIEYAWFEEYRELHPRQLRNERGELVFDLHEAKKLLRADVKAGNQVPMVPSEFQGTRTEYEEFDADIFRQRIYQEERYQKYLNWLESKRTIKLEEYREKRKKEKEKEAKKKEKEEENNRKKEEDKKRKAAKKKEKEEEKKRKKEEAKQQKAAKKRRIKK